MAPVTGAHGHAQYWCVKSKSLNFRAFVKCSEGIQLYLRGLLNSGGARVPKAHLREV